MADFMNQFWAAPPVSRTIVAAMFVESLMVYGGMMNGSRIIFAPFFLWKLPPEIWRLATTFLLTGPQFSFVFDLYFTWLYGSGLELNSPRFTAPGEFFTFVVFIATIILVTGGWLLGNYILTPALIMAFVYLFALDNRGTKAHFVIVSIPVELLPWAMLTLTLIVAGPQRAMLEGMGLIAAHLYDFLTRLYPTFQGGKNYIQTPNIVKRWFGAEEGAFTHKKHGTSYRPGQPVERSSGWTSGFSSSTWGSRGAGRRLGGD